MRPLGTEDCGSSSMALYDNSEYWSSYKDSMLLKYLLEFKEQFNLDENEAKELFTQLGDLDFKRTVALLKGLANEDGPIVKLRTRFRSYAYKQRNGLINLSISYSLKSKLDYIIENCGFADYNDLIESLLSDERDQDLELMSAIETVTSKNKK
jgi:hypothetical protein